MEPTAVVYNICRYYLQDQSVDSDLKSRVDGFRRSRDLEKLSTCSSLFDWRRHTVDDFRFLRQIEAFFKKNALFAQKDKCFDAALKSFNKTEEQCSDTNVRLSHFIQSKDRNFDLDLRAKVSIMSRYINTVLGNFDRFLDALPDLVRVTPGATAQSSRRNSIPQLKLRLQLFCTRRASRYLKAIYHHFGFKSLRCKATSTNRIELVPKNWKTDRTIACEPEGNLPLQLAFDTHTKRRLRHFGIDLRDQSANQKKAKHGSIYNDFVTVDFTAASDTISFNTVSLLIPNDWLSFLCDVRSPRYRGAFGEGTYAKFSSMGNGSTFAIETLLFAAACHAVGSRNFLVYGDDVIIEKKYYDEFIALTEFLGFTVNLDKSFHDGPFRESCGKDYFNGVDVTPVYIRGIDKRKANLCHLINTMGSLTFPGSSLGSYLKELTLDQSLPLVPFTESTLSGVWIDPREARRRGILRNRIVKKKGPRLDYFRAYTAKYKIRSFADVRGYYLWFLHKRRQVLYAGPWVPSSANISPSQASSVPIFLHAYVRKWVCWREPAEAMPDHILWSEL